MTDASTLSAAFDKALQGALLAGLVWLARHFKKNRALGRQRDAVVETSVSRTEVAMKEFGSQLAVMAGQIQARETRSAITDTKVDNLERTVERLQDTVDRIADLGRSR